MQKVKVEVIDVSVRYNKVTYTQGQTFEILPEHISTKFMKVLGEVAEDQAHHYPKEKPLSLNKEGLKALSLDGLKDYAAEFGIDLGRASTQDSIIKKIMDAQKGE